MSEFNQELCNERHESIEQHLHDLKGDMKAIKDCILGNGKLGLTTRVDRQEQRWNAVLAAFVPIYVAIIGIVVKWICSK